MPLTELEQIELEQITREQNLRSSEPEKKPYEGLTLTGAETISATPSPFQQATTKTINTAKAFINGGLFGIPEHISKETFGARGLTKGEKFQAELLGGEVIGGAIINKALKGIQKAYNLPAVKNNEFIQKAVGSIKKILKPKRLAKTAKHLEIADDRVAEALNAIHKNKETLQYVDDFGRLPTNLDEAIAASSQTKQNLLEQYTSLRKSSGEATSIDLKEIATELRNTYKTKLAGQTAKNYALKEADRLDDIVALGLDDVEQELLRYNQELKPFYQKNITGRSDISKAGVDAKIANLMRKKVDKAVTTATGTQYQPLRNSYGAVAELEEQLVKQADKIARTSKGATVGAFDTVPVIYGAFTGNIPLVTAGITQKGAKVFLQKLRDPNVITKSAFKYLDQIGTPTLLQQAIQAPLKGAAVTAGRQSQESK